MKKRLLVLFLAMMSISVLNATPKEIVFIGDSITEGFGIPKEQRKEFRFPTVFGKVLEKDRPGKYKVINFGHCGRTMLSNVKMAWSGPGYREISTTKPYMAIIMLGTNDTKAENWNAGKDQPAQFEKDLLEIIKRLKKQNHRVKIYLCTPPPAFKRGKLRTGDNISGIKVRDEIIPIIKKVAKKEKLPIIDVFTEFLNKPTLFADGIHPNIKGADAFAKFIYKEVKKDLK